KTFRKVLRAEPLSAQDMDRLTVAEHNELPGIFDHPEAPAAHFVQETLTADQPFHISHFAADRSAFGDAARGKEMDDPFLG
ncbi:MAG: hypothetical protein ACKO2N_06120, partial [Tabrizicola sp.]